MATPPLRALAAGHGLTLGAAVDAAALRDDARYRALLAREFNGVTPENALKFAPLRPRRERFDFAAAEAIVAFAEAHGMRVRGHALVWHRALPDWLVSGRFGRAELTAILREHIATVVGHFRGRVAAWDVVNEGLPVAHDPARAASVWLRGIGPAYFDLAFRWAHAADPGARLFYNDDGAEGGGAKAEAIDALVRGLLARGVPLHGVGLQGHVGLATIPDRGALAATLRRFAALGLATELTEVDVRLQDGTGTPAARLTAQAGVYHDLGLAACAAPRCAGLTVWGVTDRHSWIPGHTGRPDAPLLFDADYAPKPAYGALREALQG